MRTAECSKGLGRSKEQGRKDIGLHSSLGCLHKPEDINKREEGTCGHPLFQLHSRESIVGMIPAAG